MPSDRGCWPRVRWGRAGRPVILLHGFLGAKEDWEAVAEGLFSSVAVDLPGHGANTSWSRLPSFSSLLEGLDRQRAALGLDRWDLAGYSMGGRIALSYALRFPGKVTSLTLVSSSPGIADRDRRAERRRGDRAWADKLVHEGMTGFLEEWYRQPVFRSLGNHPDLMRAVMERRRLGDSRLLAEALTGWGQGRVASAWKRLGRLHMPVQWVMGEEDVAYAGMARTLKNLLPEARVVIVSGAGHVLPAEQPGAVARAIAGLANQAEKNSGHDRRAC